MCILSPVALPNSGSPYSNSSPTLQATCYPFHVPVIIPNDIPVVVDALVVLENRKAKPYK
jgi:hypothetical protein